MAKPKLSDWITKENLSKIQSWAMDGLTNEQIAENIGIGRSTFYEWANKRSEIMDALKTTKDFCDLQVENALFRRALGYTVKLNKQRVTKDGFVVDCIEEQHIPGDTTAQIFWLKNRKPDIWRDKQVTDVNVSSDENLKLMQSYMKEIKSGKKE